MNYLDIFSFIMALVMLIVFSSLIIIVVRVVINGKIKQTQISAINQNSFEELTRDLKADHAIMRAELADIKETLNSINKMMKDVQ